MPYHVCLHTATGEDKHVEMDMSSYPTPPHLTSCLYRTLTGTRELVWATSWGVSTRLIGAMVMSHSDDKGERYGAVCAVCAVCVLCALCAVCFVRCVCAVCALCAAVRATGRELK